jgi:hypothetical protein
MSDYFVCDHLGRPCRSLCVCECSYCMSVGIGSNDMDCSEDCFCHEGYDDSTPAQQARGLAFEESPYAEDCE